MIFEKLNYITEQCNKYCRINDNTPISNTRHELLALCESLQNSICSDATLYNNACMYDLLEQISVILQWADARSDYSPEQYRDQIEHLNK
jgi:hypothetical protein